jgi:hypothetical protein
MPAACVNIQNFPTGRILRGRLLAEGFTIEAFAKAHGFSIGTVRAVVSGRRGKRGRGKTGEIRDALAKALSL